MKDVPTRPLRIIGLLAAMYAILFVVQAACRLPTLQRQHGLQRGNAQGPEMRRRTNLIGRQHACMNGRRARTFLIVFSGHSGSTAITSELASHPQVYIRRKEYLERPELIHNSTAALLATREFFERGLASGKLPGFKLRYFHILHEPLAWAALAREFDTRVIWQYRRNLVKQAVGSYSIRYYKDKSSAMGLRGNETRSRCDVGSGCRYSINDMDVFHALLVKAYRNSEMIHTASMVLDDGRDCVFELAYEDYLYWREDSMRDLQKFLGVKYVPTASKFFKATYDRMCDVVINWSDVCRNFYGCLPWRQHFRDERNHCGCVLTPSPKKYCHTTVPADPEKAVLAEVAK